MIFSTCILVVLNDYSNRNMNETDRTLTYFQEMQPVNFVSEEMCSSSTWILTSEELTHFQNIQPVNFALEEMSVHLVHDSILQKCVL